jgi:putative nucleotidyltransferase-like protein
VAPSDEFQAMIDTLKLAVATLRERGIPFVLAGSVAAWARGGPQPRKDIDLMLKPADAEAALAALQQAGLAPERPPEEWLLKAWRDDVLVDLIFRPSGLEMTDEVLARADSIAVMAVATPVINIEDMFVTMLMALDEHRLDYEPVLGIARALREQVDWKALSARTAASPYAKAFFTLVTELGLAAPAPGMLPASPRVRVLPSSA